MNALSATVERMVPLIYSNTVHEFGWHPNTDVSRSNKCNTLTLDMLRALRGEGLAAQRELHQTSDGFWHYIINHSSDEPSETDIITNLNPWIFQGGEQYTGFLHGERLQVQDALYRAGAPEDFVALHGLATIVTAHDERIWPFASDPS